MRKITHILALVLLAGWVVLPAAGVHAETTISSVSVVDVTPSGFSVIWRTTGFLEPVIRVFADAEGTQEITGVLDIDRFPVLSGHPTADTDYTQLLDIHQLRQTAAARGTVKISVHGCAPGTMYYYRLEMLAADAVVAIWPASGLETVTTAVESTLVREAAAVWVRLSVSSGALDTGGWLLTASAPGGSAPVSAYAGDGAPDNQAFLNLGRMFGTDGMNYAPGAPQTVTVGVMGPGVGEISQTIDIPFDGTLKVGTVYPLDIVVDDILDADGDGLSTSEEAAAGTNPDNPDTDGDGMPDGWEVEYGTNPIVADADQDPDNDTYTNIEEYQAGSHPNDPASTPAATGDINADGAINLTDVIVSIKIVSGIDPGVTIHKEAAIGGDGRIGMDEVVYLLQKLAGLRN